MKIILCSDNFFFAQGAAALLQSAGHETWDFFIILKKRFLTIRMRNLP
ncbi:hypothetical protein [Mixta calida]|nr:hypothetical protein [Mixta calida]MDU4288928.1 hypothetical protein [Mixta calida]